MTKTKNLRRHFLIVQTHASYGYQIFEAHSGAYKEGVMCWPGLSPKTLRVQEEEDGYLPSNMQIHLRVYGQQGCGLRGVEDARIYGARLEIQCAHDGYNDDAQAETLAKAWRLMKSKLKKFEALGTVEDYSEICIRVAAALGYELAYRENGENRVVSPEGFRRWVQQQAEKAVEHKAVG